MSNRTTRDEMNAIARTKLQQIIERGRESAGQVIARVMNEVPEDRVIRARDLSGLVTVTESGQVVSSGRGLHKLATGQLNERLGIPQSYASSLRETDWGRALLQQSLNEHLSHSEDRFLVRSVGGEVRGILSDRYRRLDSRPLLDAFVSAVTDCGAVPYDGLASDTRMSVRAILPEIQEIGNTGELVVYGVAWQNSDFGNGAYALFSFVLRLVCTNGAMAESLTRTAHLGQRLADDLRFSQRTYDLDTEATASAAHDIVKGYFSEPALEKRNASLQAALTDEIDPKRALKSVEKSLTKGELTAVRDVFTGSENIMLPPGQNRWRFSNALSWVANQTDDAERRLELQSAAGRVLQAEC